MTSPISHSPVLSGALVRFVTDGLIATIDSYAGGRLPLHRFSWELAARIDTLEGLHPATRAITRLRWLHRTIHNLHTHLVAAGRAELTPDEENTLTITVASLRTAVATLGPHTPIDPAGAAQAANPTAAGRSGKRPAA
jgi:hypothetical protein